MREMCGKEFVCLHVTCGLAKASDKNETRS